MLVIAVVAVDVSTAATVKDTINHQLLACLAGSRIDDCQGLAGAIRGPLFLCLGNRISDVRNCTSTHVLHENHRYPDRPD